MRIKIKIPEAITVYVSNSKVTFYLETGWYLGEPFTLLGVELFECEKIDSVFINVLRIRFLYFTFAFGFEF